MEKFGIDTTYYNNLYELNNNFNPQLFDKSAFDRAKLISELLPEKRSYVSVLPKIEFTSLLRSSAATLFDLGLHTSAKKAVSVLQDITYYETDESNNYLFQYLGSIEQNELGKYKSPSSLLLPSKLDLASIHFMVHEIAHMLKESNPYECKLIYTLREVIPIFLELVSALNTNNTSIIRDVFNTRCELIRSNIIEIKRLSIIKDNMYKGAKLKWFRCVLYENLSYVNSFYYALILLDLYLKDEDCILSYVEEVLIGNMTTEEMLDEVMGPNETDTLINGMCYFSNKL